MSHHAPRFDMGTQEPPVRIDLVDLDETAASSAVDAQFPSRARTVRLLEHRLERILDFANDLGGLLDKSEFAAVLALGVTALGDFGQVRVYLTDGGGSIVSWGSAGCGDDQTDPAERPVTEIDMIGQVAATGEAAILRKMLVGRPAGMRKYFGVSRMLVPMRGKRRVEGVIELERDRRFRGEDLLVVSLYARMAALLVPDAEEAGLPGAQKREPGISLAGQRRLLEVNEKLLTNVEPQGVLDLIADSLKSLLDYDNLTIYRVDVETKTMHAVLSRDRFAEIILAATASMDHGITGWVVRHGTPQCVNDAHLDPRCRLIPGTPSEAESLVVVPLRVAGSVVGTLNVGRMGGPEAHFGPCEFELIKLFGGQASIALANAEAQRDLWSRAEIDALTGVRNRGSFDRELTRLFDSSSPEATLLMVDLDDFKTFNDRHGHRAGDRVLRAVGSAINSVVGSAGFRYGGDEFAILLGGGSAEAIGDIADRLTRELATLPTLAGRPVTASMGSAHCPADARTQDELVAAADAALYLAKGIE